MSSSVINGKKVEPMSKKGFTLIELLVVIAIIALLLAIIMPSLQFVKKQAELTVCLSNLSNLSKAWYAYAGENDDKMAGGHPALTSTWVCVPQTEDGASRTSGSEIDEKIIGIMRGQLYPYLENSKVYHCNGDERWREPSLSTSHGGMGGYRSYSITCGMNGVDWPEIIRLKKHTNIRSPGSKYVFVEEMDGRGYNAGAWAIYSVQQQWIDPIAIWHNNFSTLGFADGHAEGHRWFGEGTIGMAESQTFWWFPESEADIKDFLFMQKGYAYKELK